MLVELEHITFGYTREPVLHDLTTRLPDAALTALVGPNGSGKSTLIKCLNGLLRVQKGRVLLDGCDVQSLRPAERARRVAYVPQTGNRIAPMSVFDAVLLGRKPYSYWKPTSDDLDHTATILEQLGLGQIAMRDLRTLSGGQQQRAYLARALNQQPELLLLDEPTANLDLRYQSEILERLRVLARQGITVVMAIHDINQASWYADQVLMLKQGRLFAEGPPETIDEQTVGSLFGVSVRMVRSQGMQFMVPEPGEQIHPPETRCL